MLKHLLIKNYTLIDHLEMAPSAALNIITGETGAGKSIMLGAVGLLLGNRADTRALLNNANKCIVEGAFYIESYQLQNLFETLDLDYEVDCIIRREINPSGKSRAFINDTPVNLDALKILGQHLMDIHSQNDTLNLGSNSYQLSLIDAYAGTQTLVTNCKEKFKIYQEANRAFEELKQQAEQIKKDADYNNFLLEELSKAQLQQGEQEEMEEELKRLENAEEIKLVLNQILDIQENSEFAVLNSLTTALGLLSKISNYQAAYVQLKERLQSNLLELKDIASELSNEEQRVDVNLERTEEVNERLSLIYQLQQKHLSPDIAGLLRKQEELESQVHIAQNLEEEIENAQAKKDGAYNDFINTAQQLSGKRKSILQHFSKEIQEVLSGLGMQLATVAIDHKETAPQPTGIDAIRFLFSANKGIAPSPLKEVASGGEFSRFMFAIKYLLADKTALPSIIFDEIDTGISGEVAMKMVSMMKVMAKNHQVVAISHLPQFAARGDAHFFVYKDNTAEKAASKVRELKDEERVEEIAKMIGGDSPSPVAFENARELMGD